MTQSALRDQHVDAIITNGPLNLNTAFKDNPENCIRAMFQFQHNNAPVYNAGSIKKLFTECGRT